MIQAPALDAASSNFGQHSHTASRVGNQLAENPNSSPNRNLDSQSDSGDSRKDKFSGERTQAKLASVHHDLGAAAHPGILQFGRLKEYVGGAGSILDACLTPPLLSFLRFYIRLAI